MADSKITIAVKLLFIAASFCIVLVLSALYFQQDEWHSFGLILGYREQYLLLDKPLWQAVLSDRIGARAIVYGLFSTFGVNAVPFGLLGGILHVLNAYLAVRLVYMFTQNRTASWFSGLFFLLNSVSHQAYSWFGTMAGSTPSVTCILFSLLFFKSYLDHRRIADYALSFIFVSLSFLFKETGFFLLVIYPAVWVLHTKGGTVVSFMKENALWILYGIGMAVLLVYTVITIPGDRANYIAPERSGYLSLISRSFVYPFESSAHVFLPAEVIYSTARIITRIVRPDLQAETSEFDIFYQTTMVEWLSICMGGLLLAGIWISRKNKTLVTGALLLYASFAPYIVLARFDAYLDSRYYYTPLIGGTLLFGYCIHLFVKKRRAITYASASIIVLLHMFYLSTQLYEQYERSAERKYILSRIIELVPDLQERTVFYITGNTPGYYGIEELKVPFQSGLGQVLMVLYGYHGNLSENFFQEETFMQAFGVGFLYDTLDQGYRDIDGRGFGYFYDENVLNEHLKSGKFSEENVVRLFYDIDSRKIIMK